MMNCQCGNADGNLQKYLKPLKKILENFEKKEKDLIPVLQRAQEAYGYLPKEVLIEVGKQLGLSFVEVYGVVTFYSQFHLEPRGENIIRVCMGTACHVRGGGQILEKIKSQLKIDDGETTEDLEFTLETVACIGACGLAPVIMINDDTHGRLEPKDIPEILKSYQEKKTSVDTSEQAN
jgi:NADH-quinone oxidoreductase subunit E/NADP-reducing hydrogenase subunit HndA